MCCAVFAASLPLLVRIVICLSFAPFYASCVRGVAQLRGRRAVRALGWTEEGALVAWFGSRATPVPAIVMPGSFRLGTWMLVLTLQSQIGRHAVLLDGSAQDPAAYRRLCQRLEWPLDAVRGAAGAQADTIHPKV